MKFALTVSLFAILAAVTPAQAPRAFDAASVKKAGGPGPSVVAVTGSTRVSAPFATLRELVRVAYGMNENQVVGGPDWVGIDRFELGATAAAGSSIENIREMLRTLLAERFGLAVHPEKRDLPMYALTFSGTLGPKMRKAGPECGPLAGPPGVPVPPPPPPPPAGAGSMTVLGQPPGSKCGIMIMRGFFSARDVGMETFSVILMRELGRPVVDRSGLTDNYDIDLNYLPDSGPMTINGQAINGDAPPLTTAVREQLGLRLDSGRAPVDVIVIDHASQPTAN